MPNIKSTKDLYAVVRETSAMVNDLGVGKRDSAGVLSGETAADYAKIGRARLDLSAEDGGRLMQGVTRQSWTKVRAAVLHEAERAVKEQRRICDVSQRAMKATKDKAEAWEAFQLASDAAIKANRAARAFAAVIAAEKPLERSLPKASKRKSLPRLSAKDWRQGVYDRATPAMKAAVAAMWAGARPCEVEKGVEIEELELDEGTIILVRIKGAKITENSGQSLRKIAVAKDSALGAALAAHAGPVGEPATISRPAARMNKDFAWMRKDRAIPKGISPYSLRHAFCADLKKDGYDPENIAQAMGHASARSQGNYGSVRQGTGGIGVVGIEADREVRMEWNRGPRQSHEPEPDL
jgi:integrase